MPEASARTGPDPETIAADPRGMLAQNVDVVRHIIHTVARRQRVSQATIEDLESAVWMRLVEHDYRALRQDCGRSSLRTFLTVVIGRILLDVRAEQWGRWRPSTRARRLGKAGIRFESLVFRDGMKVDEAMAVLQSNGMTLAADEVDELAGSLRSPSRRFVPIEEVPDPQAAFGDPESPIASAQRSRRSRQVTTALRSAVNALSPEDRRLLRMRHSQGLKVSTIAGMLRDDQRALYRRLNIVHDAMRRMVERAGITRDDVRDMVGQNDVALPSVL